MGGDTFSARVRSSIDECRADLDRQFYNRFISGQLSRDELRAYYQRLYHECSYFVRLISLIHSQAPDRYSRELIARNIVEEYGQGTIENNHPYLAMKVGTCLGMSEKEIEDSGPTAEVEAYYGELFGLARSSFIEGLAALCFHEADLPTRLSKMRKALLEHYGYKPEQLRYYDEHIAEGSSISDASLPGYGGDDVHVMRQVDCIERHAGTPAQKESVFEALRRTARARDVYNRALATACLAPAPT